ncbi:Geranylgeranyl transferase type-2 subunit alpha [Myotis brandtii]|uniref:Geranylgeranyl transferase type-2 subunit alpha n=1 Tax=Myotis brandtii TaxID=109478 RepID=S7MGS0_MYOBR|nr:Geranylgeranyl transferase type-2 subunit alpha [Myotis brandtii]
MRTRTHRRAKTWQCGTPRTRLLSPPTQLGPPRACRGRCASESKTSGLERRSSQRPSSVAGAAAPRPPSGLPAQHGRLKVKTSEEQAEAKRLEREQKLKLYRSATQTVFQKRQAGELDESVLELTSQILGANPDFATLWNCRREVLQRLEAQKSPEELAALVKAELGFLESCLRVNPKSYGTWHHRCWLLSRLPEPNWARELELCARFLEVDERNFHCWDYRRFVAAQAAVPPAEELAFTDSLIVRNFSNYSSWHYRSCLLPQLHPQPDSGPQGRLPEDVLLKELELVQNAFFTDPNDQSAWFYHRWLLGRADPQDALRCLHVSRDEACLTVSFSRPLLVDSGMETLLLFADESPLAVEWRTPDGRNRPSPVWVSQDWWGIVGAEAGLGWDSQKSGHHEGWCRDSATDEQLFRCELSIEKSTVLQSELKSCKELQELEPENKWCLLTIILLMRALDPLLYEKETLQYFQTLKASRACGNRQGGGPAVDPMRAAYLDDLRSKFLLENSVLKMEYAEVRVLHLSHKDLTVLCHLEQLLLITHLDLSHNRLRALPPALAALRCLEVLQASDNAIESLDGVTNLPRLQELLLCNNRLQQPAALQPVASCPKLVLLNLQGNPLCQTVGTLEHLAELLPSVSSILT